VDLQERHQLEAAREQVAKVKARTRPWRYIFALVLAVVAAAVSVQARYVANLADDTHSGSVLDALGKQGNLALSYGTAVAFGLLAGAGTIGLGNKTREVLGRSVGSSHAAVLNVANVSRECQVERKTIATYIEVLDDLLLSFRIPVFSRRAKRDTSTHPKFFLFDAGVFRSLRPKGPLDRPDRRRGARGPRRTAFARVARLPWR